jgi:ADP-ribose pyrophosphatase YjhB (NUDIX family)
MVSRCAFNLVQRFLLQPLHRQRRGLTLGTRIAVFDAEGRVLLVRHTYAPGWLLPGGGVERGETVRAAAVRELAEETGVVAEEEPVLFDLLLNDRQFPGDHVALLVLRRFRREPFRPSAEIAAAEFFNIAALPEGTTPGTKRRLAEVLEGKASSHAW